MKSTGKSRSKLMLWGIAISIVAFFGYYLFLEEKVLEYRLTYSLSTEKYAKYKSDLEEYSANDEDFHLLSSPYYESIADSLIDKGLRRFELKVFYAGDFECTETSIGLVFFKERYIGLPPPELITNRFVSSNTPLKTSMGITMLILTSFLLIDYLLSFRKR